MGDTRNEVSCIGETANHSVDLTGTLEPGTFYYARAESTKDGTTVQSLMGYFSTASNSSGEMKVYFNKISDPRKLEKSEWNFKRRFGRRNQKGIEKVLDTMDFYIPTSFVVKDKLLHIYNDDNGTYIANIENKKMKVIYTFNFKFYPQFNQQLENGKQVLTFENQYKPNDNFTIITDVAFSNEDLNTFSTLDNEQNYGLGTKIEIRHQKKLSNTFNKIQMRTTFKKSLYLVVPPFGKTVN